MCGFVQNDQKLTQNYYYRKKYKIKNNKLQITNYFYDLLERSTRNVRGG